MLTFMKKLPWRGAKGFSPAFQRRVSCHLGFALKGPVKRYSSLLDAGESVGVGDGVVVGRLRLPLLATVASPAVRVVSWPEFPPRDLSSRRILCYE